MKKLKLTKLISSTLIAVSVVALNPIGANAEWKSNSNGWWYTEGSSWATGWRLIDKNWYYFYSNGYMAHDTAIDGYYLNSSGAWTNSASDIISQEILKNVSVENPTFNIQCSSSDIKMDSAKSVIESAINKLKITNPYEMYNVSDYKVDMSSYGSGPINMQITCTYKMTAEMAADLDERVKEILAAIAPDSMSQSEKERAIHDWIINNTSYDQSYSIFDPYNTLIKHTGVCEGYALLAQKMFTTAGIKSMVVAGTAGGEDHAWNLVYIDSKWRHVDCTWDDPVSSYGNVLRYDYYNLTDDEMSADHSWDTSAYPHAD